MVALNRASRWMGAFWILAVSTLTVPGDIALAAAAFDGTSAGQADMPLSSYHPQPAVPPKDAGYVMPDGTISIVGFDDMEGMLSLIHI